MPNPPGANPLVAERVFPTSDYWGRTGVARCAEEMRQVGISNRLLTPVTQDCEDLQGALSATRGLAPGGLGTRQLGYLGVADVISNVTVFFVHIFALHVGFGVPARFPISWCEKIRQVTSHLTKNSNPKNLAVSRILRRSNSLSP